MKQHQKRAKNSTDSETTARYYLTNATLLPAVLRAKALGHLTDDLAKMLMILTRKYAQRPCFSGYTYKEDMISEALTNLCQNALKFKPEVSDNPFSFYTSCINNSFLQFLNVEKKHRKIRDQLLIDMGENPSYNFSEEHRMQNAGEGGEFKSELSELKTQIEEARARVILEEKQRLAALEAEAALAAAELDEVAVVSLLEFEVVEEEVKKK